MLVPAQQPALAAVRVAAAREAVVAVVAAVRGEAALVVPLAPDVEVTMTTTMTMTEMTKVRTTLADIRRLWTDRQVRQSCSANRRD